MKKTLLSLLFISAATAAQARQKGVCLMPQVSIGRGSMSGLHPGYTDVKPTSFFSIGCEGFYMLSPHLGFGTGVSLGHYTFKAGTDDYNNLLARCKQGTVEVPLFLRLAWGVKNGFFVQGGVVASMLISAEDLWKTDQQPCGFTVTDRGGTYMSRCSASPFLYLGAHVALGRAQLIAGPQIQYQLNNNFRNAPDGRQGHYCTMAFKAGISFPGRKAVKESERRRLLAE